MQYYTLICEDTDNALEKRKTYRPQHLARLTLLAKEKRLLTAGPLLNDHQQPIGSLIIAQFDSHHAAQEWIAHDIFIIEKIYKNVTIKPFLPGDFS